MFNANERQMVLIEDNRVPKRISSREKGKITKKWLHLEKKVNEI